MHPHLEENETYRIRYNCRDEEMEKKVIDEIDFEIIIKVAQNVFPRSLHDRESRKKSDIVPQMFWSRRMGIHRENVNATRVWLF